MAQKNATPTREQQASIKAAELNPIYWVVLKDLPSSLIIKHRWTGEVKYINKVKENLS
jgi:hypothetical protein